LHSNGGMHSSFWTHITHDVAITLLAPPVRVHNKLRRCIYLVPTRRKRLHGRIRCKSC
jgi:hypothetical protein